MTYGSIGVPFLGLRREIDRLFEDAIGRGGRGGWTPSVDVRETSKALELDFELPGIKAEDVDISIENNVLTVRGEKREERKEDEEGRYHIVERSYGSFTRSFQLPLGVDEEQIEAEFDSGLLRVSIPKAALPQPRRIEIGSGKKREISGGQSRNAESGQTQTESGRGQPRSRSGAQDERAMAAKGRGEE